MSEASRLAWSSARAEDRLSRVIEALAALPPAAEALLVGPTREVADELGRRAARARGGASFGTGRTTLHRLALDLAGPELARRELVAAEATAREALVRRTIAVALDEDVLLVARGDGAAADVIDDRRAVLRSPGYPRAVAATLDELRLAGVEPASIRARAVQLRAGPTHESGRADALDDLATLAERHVVALEASRVADRRMVLDAAIRALERGAVVPAVVAFVDVAVPSAAERAFAGALARRATRLLWAIPDADADAAALAAELGAALVRCDTLRPGSLAAVQRDLFADAPTGAADDGAVQWASAPGETREAVEVARRVLAAARRGVPFDAIAIAVRSREVHGAAIEAALARAGIPAWFEAGTRRPHPAGRTVLALLACRREGLSARRFAEALSLGEMGREGDEANDAIAGSSRWERLLREAAVIGGRDRWQRRLAALAASKRAAAASLARTDPEAGRVDALLRDVAALDTLIAFASPIVDALAELPPEAPLATWADRLQALAAAALREPEPVVGALAELHALGGDHVARLDVVESALDPLLRWLERPRPTRRHGRVLVTTPEGLRGRSLRVVVIPGLAERLFPPPVREDPLLPDEDRLAIAPALALREHRTRRERLLLALAVGAAEEGIALSYPRTEAETGRPRVPSLYALELLRARDGALPDLGRIAREASRASGGRMAWPAPLDPVDAVDEAEHDLAILGALLADPDPSRIRGRARYLLEENEHLGRALRARYARWQLRGLRTWDGARIESERARAVLARSRLTARAHAPSTLRHFAACPYRFFLHGVVGLRESVEPQAIEQLDPAARGDIHHRALAELQRVLEARGWSAMPREHLGEMRLLARQITRQEGERARDDFAPRVPRVLDDAIDDIATDVEAWVVFAVREAEEQRWMPHRFDLAFGLPPDDHLDPRSAREPARIGPFLLRGAIDAVERNLDGDLRVTDYKTGTEDAPRQLVVGGGETLQPVLYAMALEAHGAALGTPGRVDGARLLYASARGGFRERWVRHDEGSRRAGRQVLEAIDAAIDRGVLPALPREGACTGCAFRGLCGPAEERRARGKTERADAHVRDELARVRGMK